MGKRSTEMKNKIMRGLGILLVGVILTITVPSIAMAATTADVTITASPTYIAITNTPNNYDFGVVLAGTNKSSLSTQFTANNTGNVASNVSIAAILTAGNWSGGQGWIHSNTGTPGADQAGLIAGLSGWVGNVTVSSTAAWFMNGLAAATTQQWGVEIQSPTSFGDGTQKTMIVRLTIYEQ